MFTRDESRVLAWSGTSGSPGEVKLWDVSKAEPLQVWKHDGAVSGAVFTRDESRVLAWSGRIGSPGEVKLWDVSKAEPLQVWKHDKDVVSAAFTLDETRVRVRSGDGAEKLWDAALKDLDLTPAQRILELEVRSARRLGSAGQLIWLNSNEWTTKVSSREYAEIQKKMEANDRSPTSGIARKVHLE